MVTQNTNPFVLPGFGQSGDMANNPMLASMEMMRKAWEGLAGANVFDQSLTTPGASPEDLQRRIADLRAVENWLRMNLSMLSSTIQALEVQQSTMATLQAFVASAGMGSSDQPAPPSPLDVALGIRRGSDAAPSADTSGLFGASPATTPPNTGQAAAAPEAPPATSADVRTADQPDSAPAGATDTAMQSWWDMLQTQFDNLASATSATLQGAEAMQDAATAAQQKAVDSTREAAEALKKSTASVASPAGKAPAKKATVKKTAVKKTAARKAAGKTASVTSSPAKKAASRKTAVKSSAATKTAAKKVSAKKAAAKKTARTTRKS